MPASPPYRPPHWIRVLFLALACLGGAALVIGMSSEARRVWVHLFVASNFAVWLAAGALTMIALDAVTGARWSLPLRRLQEASLAVMPFAGLGLMILLVFQPSLIVSGEGMAQTEYVSPLRSSWMSRPFFLIRAIVYLGLWMTFAVAIVRGVRRQEREGDGLWGRNTVRVAAAFLVVFGITCWLASYDWIMTLQPGWYSTVFGVYNFAGTILSALAGVTLLAVILRRYAPLRTMVTEECLHDLGTLLFGFSSFWMYIWYCQYLLIWYTNHPDETIYLRERWQGAWLPYLFGSLALNWVVPFLVLLPRGNKHNTGVLACVSLILLAGRWVDLVVMIGPSQGQSFATFGAIEAGIALGTVGVLGLCVCWSLARLPLVPEVVPELLPSDPLYPAPASQ